jgi:para-nitrobenzyl esterase
MALRSLPVFILAVLALVFGADITVNPPAGPVVGREDAEGTISFLGIPFAEPPLNERRWRKPEPKKSWSEPLNAFEFRSDCAQGPNGFAPTSSEDCLFLQVWTPSVNEPNLPVQVWHYGGSFLNGSTSYPMYNGAKVARENNG